MKDDILFLEIFQPYAQYRNPLTFYYAQTYPLPPPTTIIGMLQNLTRDYYSIDYFKSLEVSVHGGFESTFWNYQQLIKGTPYIGKWGDTYLLMGKDGRPLYGPFKSQRTPVYQQELFNGHLYIFLKEIRPTGILSKIKHKLENLDKVLYLGRSEDVAYIRFIGSIGDGSIEVSMKGEFNRSLRLTYPTYVRFRGLQISTYRFPVYSVPVLSYFINEGGEQVEYKEQISKNKTERKVMFEPVIYTDRSFTLIVNSRYSFTEYKVRGKKFRIIDEFGWLGGIDGSG